MATRVTTVQEIRCYFVVDNPLTLIPTPTLLRKLQAVDKFL